MERLSSNIKILKMVVEEKGFYNSPIFEDDDISVGDKLEQLEQAVIDSIDDATAMYEEVLQEKENFSFEVTNIQDFLRRTVNSFKGSGTFSIEFSLTNELIEWKNSYKEAIKVNLAPQKFQKLIENLITNAEKHAFTDAEKTNYEILFELGIDLSNNAETICLSYKDNGEGFPVGAV